MSHFFHMQYYGCYIIVSTIYTNMHVCINHIATQKLTSAIYILTLHFSTVCCQLETDVSFSGKVAYSYAISHTVCTMM